VFASLPNNSFCFGLLWGSQDGKRLEIPGLVGSVDVCALKLLIENEWGIKPADQRLVHKHHEVTGESNKNGNR